MNATKNIYLLNDEEKFLIKKYKTKANKKFAIQNEDFSKKLLDYGFVKYDSINKKTFIFTTSGLYYCKNLIEKQKNTNHENIIKWASLGLSVLAFILSVLSLIIQYKDFKNSEQKNARDESKVEISEIETTIEYGMS